MSTLQLTTLANQTGTRSIPVDRVAQGTAAAWVNFNGTGTVTIRAQYNVSSITDNGTADFTVNFASPLPDASYAIAPAQTTAVADGSLYSFKVRSAGEATANGVRLVSYANQGGSDANVIFDPTLASVAIFR